MHFVPTVRRSPRSLKSKSKNVKFKIKIRSRSEIRSDPRWGRSGGVGCFSPTKWGMWDTLCTPYLQNISCRSKSNLLVWSFKPISCIYSKGGTYPTSYTVSPALYYHPGTCEDVKIKIELKSFVCIRCLSADGVRTSLPHSSYSGLGLGLVGGLWVRCHLHPPYATQMVRQ